MNDEIPETGSGIAWVLRSIAVQDRASARELHTNTTADDGAAERLEEEARFLDELAVRCDRAVAGLQRAVRYHPRIRRKP